MVFKPYRLVYGGGAALNDLSLDNCGFYLDTHTGELPHPRERHRRRRLTTSPPCAPPTESKAMAEVLALLGKHIRRMDLLGSAEGVEDSDGEARTCRLAMLLHSEDPANDPRVSELLDLPLDEYQDYVDDVLTQLHAGAEPVRQTSGVYHVPLASGETAVLRPLKGRHRRLLGRLGEANADWTLITRPVQPVGTSAERDPHRRLPGGDGSRKFFVPASHRAVDPEAFARSRVIMAERGILTWTESDRMDLREFFQVVVVANRTLRK